MEKTFTEIFRLSFKKPKIAQMSKIMQKFEALDCLFVIQLKGLNV